MTRWPDLAAAIPADDKVRPGWLGFLVVAGLCVVTYLLWRSMNTQLKRVGRRMQVQCPFPSHNDKSPAFSVNVEEGLYYCFGCGKRGDAITFVREMEGLDFESAVERLGWLITRRKALWRKGKAEGWSVERRRKRYQIIKKATLDGAGP